jgi:ring-1,2-phenylacetyl-CoA epoxidase subunit PaaE
MERVPRGHRQQRVEKTIVVDNARVVQRWQETPRAVTIELEVDHDLGVAQPGQFITVDVTIDGKRHKRAYSIVAQPALNRVRIGVKQIDGGLVSTKMCGLAIGDAVAVRGPLGLFVVAPDVSHRKQYVCIAGGSGITPIFAMVNALLAHEPNSSIHLIYGNRSVGETMYRTALMNAAATAHGRLQIRFVDEVADAAPLLSSVQTRVGRLDNDVLQAELAGIMPTADTIALLCGPSDVMNRARALLQARGVAADNIKEERFGSPHRSIAVSDAAAVPLQTQNATIRLGQRTYQIKVSPSQTLLEAGTAAGIAMPSSCTMGGCGACTVTIESGTVLHEEPNCLSSAELNAGKCLACVARLSSDCTVRIG